MPTSIKPLSAARAFIKSGLSVIPIRDDSKRPAISWKTYQSRQATKDEINDWFTSKFSRMAIIAGHVSGNLEILDFDQVGLFPTFKQHCEKHEPGLLSTLPTIETPSGGIHVYYRCEQLEGNTKLAEYDNEGVLQVAIETRGEGGYVVCPPSEGYTFLEGAKLTKGVPTISTSQRSLLFSIARSLGKAQLAEPDNPFVLSAPVGSDVKPGDAYNEDWQQGKEELLKHGWKLARTRNDGTEEWVRPGKKDEGISATFGHGDSGATVFYVFSSNATPFQPMTSYTPFGVYATLNHQGDFAAAARALASEGKDTLPAAPPPVPRAAEAADEEDEPDTYPYLLDEKGRIWYKPDDKRSLIADFTAQITEHRIGEDGEDYYFIEGQTMHGKKFKVEIRSDQFEDTRQLRMVLGAAAGANAAIHPNKASHLSAAIKKVSDIDLTVVKRYKRTGWAGKHFLMPGRKIEGVRQEAINIPYRVSEDANLDNALNGLHGLINSHGPNIGAIVVGHMLAPPLFKAAGIQAQYALHVTGLSGSLKTNMAMAAMTIWGEGFGLESKIIKWGQGATSNALIALAAEASDMPFFIDNYKPQTGRGSHDFIGFMHNVVEGGEKWRSSMSGHVRSDHRDLHCWPFTTGEDVVDTDAASVARMLIVKVAWPKDQQNLELRKAQDARTDMNAIGREWIKYLESKPDVIKQLKETFNLEQEKWAQRLLEKNKNTLNVLRIARNFATVKAGYTAGCHCPAFGEVLNMYYEHLEPSLNSLVDQMGFYSSESREAVRFIEALREAISSGDAVLDTYNPVEVGTHVKVDFADRGKVIGWSNRSDDEVYLMPKKSMGIAGKIMGSQMSITPANLGLQLESIGMIKERSEERPTKVKRIQDTTQRVWILNMSAIYGESTGISF